MAGLCNWRRNINGCPLMMESDQSSLSSLHTLKLDLQMRLCVFMCVWLTRGGYNVTLLCAACAAVVVIRKHVCFLVFHVFPLAAYTIMMHWPCRLTPTYDPTYLPGQDSPDKDQISKEEMSFDPPNNLNWG